MTKPLGQWKLPQPTDLQEDNEWVPIPRVARTVPFGYEIDPDDSGILLPIEHELDMLVKAKKYLNNATPSKNRLTHHHMGKMFQLLHLYLTPTYCNEYKLH